MVELCHAVLGLHCIYLRCIVHVVTEEVDSLASRVNLSLEEVLALAKHGGGVHDGAVLSSKQLSHLHHDSGTSGPGSAAPLFPSLHGSINSHFNLFLAYLVVTGNNVLVVVWAGNLAHIAGANLFATNDDRYFNHHVALALKFFL